MVGISFEFNKLDFFFRDEMIELYIKFLKSEKQELICNIIWLLTNSIYDAESEVAVKLIINTNLFKTILAFLDMSTLSLDIFESLTIYFSLSVKICGEKFSDEVVRINYKTKLNKLVDFFILNMKDKTLKRDHDYIAKKIFTYSFLGLFSISEFAESPVLNKIFENAIPYELINNNYEGNTALLVKSISIIGNVMSCNDYYIDVLINSYSYL